jgi:hypothetical protein
MLEVRRAVLRGVLCYWELGAAVEVSGVQASDNLDALVTLLPACWVAGSRDVLQGTATAPTELDAWSALLRGLSWQPPDGRPVPLLGLTVKAATSL